MSADTPSAGPPSADTPSAGPPSAEGPPSVEALRARRDAALAGLAAVTDEAGLEAWYRSVLSPSGEATGWKRSIGKVPKEQRKDFGQAIHEATGALELAFAAAREAVSAAALARRLAAERVDLTLPPRPRRRGGLHPLTLARRRIEGIFGAMGFQVYDAPHVELDEYNFQLVNIPPDHPARDMQDTFFFDHPDAPDARVLRTHTTAGQVRAMRELGPGPLRVILPGLCYRNEDITTRSEMQFHQVEGLLVGEGVRMSDLKGVLLEFARQMFGPHQDVRLRGSYFPFTEPSVEVDVRCALCGGSGCRVCKHSGWLEILGAGLVHPTVLRNGGYDPATHQGIAFGMGIERVVMLLHDIDDIRQFFRNDLRFLAHFR